MRGRTTLTVVLALLAGVIAGGLVAMNNPAVLESAWKYLPQSLQLKPRVYAQHAASIIEHEAFAGSSVDWHATRAEVDARAAQGSTLADAHQAIALAIIALGDGRSVLLPPAPDSRSGAYGFQVLFPERLVAVVYPGSTAEAAGLRAGDVIEAVDGQPPVVSRDPRAREHLVHLPTPEVSLTVLPQGRESERREVHLARGPFQALPAVIRRVGGDIGYLELPGTTGPNDFAERVRRAIVEPEQPLPCAWIVDVRRNAGGDLTTMMEAVRPLLGTPPFGAYIDAAGERSEWSLRAESAMPDPPPVAVLVSRLTAGAAETLVVAMRGREGTRVFGEPTWGLGTGTTDFTLPDGTTLQLLTRREVDRQNRVQAGPVTPDALVPTPWPTFGAGDDAVLVAATTWLKTSCQ